MVVVGVYVTSYVGFRIDGGSMNGISGAFASATDM